MRKIVSSLALTMGAAAFCSTAFAAPFIPDPGPTYFQFTNKEQVDIRTTPAGAPVNNTSTCAGCSGAPEGNWGIAQLSILRGGVVVNPGVIGNDIDNAGGVPQFVDLALPTALNQVTAIFWGITQTSIVTSGSVVSLKSTGGFIDLWYDEPGLVGGGTLASIGTALPGSRTSDNTFPTFTDGIFLGRLEFASGIDPLDATTFIQGTIDTSLANSSGSADSYANVVDVNSDGMIDSLDGLWAGVLDSDFFLTAFGSRDVRFSNKIDLTSDWDGAPGVLGLTSNDPGRFYAAPEPGSVALLGLALFGIAFARRRRNS